MKKSLIESQHPSGRAPSISRGFASGRALNTDQKTIRQIVVNITPELNMYTSTQFVSSQAQPIFGANKNRRYLLIQNVGAVTVYLGFGSTPNTNGDNGIELPSGFQISFESGFVPNNECTAIAPAQSKITVLEGVLIK